MERLLFTLVLALTAWVIQRLAGGNRRQFAKVPEGMAILCQPPGKRYVLYALGGMVAGIVLFFGVLYILDGVPVAARPMWFLCAAVALLTLAVCIVGGNMLAEECVYFGDETLQVNRAFREPKIYRWHNVRTIRGSFDREITLYTFDGNKILTAGAAMLNYDVFFVVLKTKCPSAAADYYRAQRQEKPKACVLRYGAEYYLLAVMGILMLGIYLALLLSSGGGLFLQEILQSDTSQWLSLLFPPVSGVVGLVALFVFCNTKVRYSPEALVLKYPLRREQELPWSSIQKMEVVLEHKQGKAIWKKLRLYTKQGVYKLNMGILTSGRDGFLTELYKMIEKYEIPLIEAKR